MTLGTYVVSAIGIGVAVLVLTRGRPPDVDTFAQPSRTVVERLEAKQRVVNGSGLGSLTIRKVGRDRGALLLDVAKAGEPRSATCRLTVSPASAAETRVATDCNQPGKDGSPMRRLGTDALTIVVREHVAATVDDRPYDIDRVADRIIALVAINPLAVAASLRPPPP